MNSDNVTHDESHCNKKVVDTVNSVYPDAPGHKGVGTSLDAAIKIAPHAKTVRHRVLQLYANSHPNGLTPDQAASALNESILTVRPRCAELKRLGLLKATADTRPNDSGHNATVMVVTPKGLGEAGQ